MPEVLKRILYDIQELENEIISHCDDEEEVARMNEFLLDVWIDIVARFSWRAPQSHIAYRNYLMRYVEYLRDLNERPNS